MTEPAERSRAFCSLCGALIKPPFRVVDGRLRCRAHGELPSEQPRDERSSIATMLQEAERLPLERGPAREQGA